mmetsp:Transcript_68063/g.138047  ORF Transcript_68063/g.138047 Transcript_68063/m.138047 type:complete len:1036 (+) Transcript_68063:48-3155(+)
MQPSADLWQKVPGYSSDDEDARSGFPEPTTQQLESRLTEVLASLGSRYSDRPTIQFRAAPLPGSKAQTSKSRSSTCCTCPPAFLLNSDAPILRDTFQLNGMIPTMCNDYAIQWSGPNIRDNVYQCMMDWQRINHFPNSTELTRKDRLWLHFAQMAKNYGKGCFDFVPETYVLPDNFDAFLKCYQRSRCHWIVKPNASSRGRGIFILQDLSELPLDETVVVSRYVQDPLLIQGYKFDLRVYVLVTSYDPLKAYIYREGLTRFASAPYSTQEEHMQDAFRHLTNYSVNKNSNTFVENSDMRADNVGHKWSLSALNKHLRCVGVDVNLMWVRIMDLIVKTLLSVEPAISSRTKQLTGNRENCFELYGFDVLVDSDLKPWLLEVNLSPSMQAESPLDWQIKSSLLADTFNLVGIHSNERTPKLDRMRATYCQPWKQNGQGAKENRKDDVPNVDDSHAPLVLNALSDGNLKMLAKSIGERSRCHNFVVLYPTRAAVKRYGMITEARAQQLAPRGASLLSKVNRCLSQSQMLASLLYGPFPSRSATELKRAIGPSESFYNDLFVADVEDWPPEEPTGPNPVLADLESILQASSPISWKDLRPAFFTKPLPAAVNPTVESELRETALASARRALGALSGTSRSSPQEQKCEDDEEEDSSREREFPASGSCLLLMEYLIRLEATCESLAPAGRARLVQSASYARLSKFQRTLPKVFAKLASLSNRSSTPPEAVSENGCLVEDMTAVCRESLHFLEQLAWPETSNSEVQDTDERLLAQRRFSGDQPRCLSKRLPNSLLQDKHCRRLLKALPDLQAADLEKLLWTNLIEEFGDDASLQRMLECFRNPAVVEEQLCTDFRRSASIQPGLIKEPTSRSSSLQKSRSMLPVIHGESAKMPNEGRKAPGPLSEILCAVMKEPLSMQRSVRRPQTISRPSRSTSLRSNLRGVVLGSSTLTSFLSKTSSHKSLVPDVKEAKVMANVMMPVPRFVSMRRPGSKSRAIPELPEVKGADGQGSRPADQRDAVESPTEKAAYHASATNLKFDIEL